MQKYFKFPFLIAFNKMPIAAKPHTNESAVPTANAGNPIPESDTPPRAHLIISTSNAPAIIGTLIKKEKSAASSRSTPQSTAAERVVPLRDSPGITATACDNTVDSIACSCFRLRQATRP